MRNLEKEVKFESATAMADALLNPCDLRPKTAV